jgi:hypothetical protein
VAAGTAYLRARALSLPFAVLSALGTITLQAAGRTKLTLLTNCVAMPVNLVASWCLIYGAGPLPALGAAGNGLGLTLSLLAPTPSRSPCCAGPDSGTGSAPSVRPAGAPKRRAGPGSWHGRRWCR